MSRRSPKLKKAQDSFVLGLSFAETFPQIGKMEKGIVGKCKLFFKLRGEGKQTVAGKWKMYYNCEGKVDSK
jgi:hypothetical protein